MSRAARPSLQLLALLLLVVAPLLGSIPAGAESSEATVYVVDSSTGPAVQPLDPRTLADVGEPRGIVANSALGSALWISGDGSTAVVADFDSVGADWSTVLRVVDVVSGAERSTFPIAGEHAYVTALSRDGGRVVVSDDAYDKVARSSVATWTVHDTTTGAVVSTFALPNPDGRWFAVFVDDAAAHMWLQSSTATTPTYGGEQEMGATVLHSVDLVARREVGRLTLGSVKDGLIAGDAAFTPPVFENVFPAVALSPDNRTLAVVEAASERITLVDGRTMTRVGSVTAHARDGLAGRLLRWAGVLPSDAGAKWQVGDWRSAFFSADGRSLYLTGGSGELTGQSWDDYHAEWLGIRRVDLATGEVTATALDGGEVDRVIPVPSGDLYVVGPERPWTDSEGTAAPTVLRRLNGRTRDVEASRTLDTTTWQVIVTEA